MSRRFQGSAAGDRPLHMSLGALGTLGGALTVAWIWKPISVVASGVYKGVVTSGATPATINPYSDGKIYWASGGSFKGITGYTASDGWRIDAFSHEAGGAGAAPLRFHSMLYSNNVWSHIGEGTIGDSPPPNSEVLLGGFADLETSDAEFAAIGVWGSSLSDLNIETLDTSLANWMSLSPVALWAFNQTDVTTPVTDLTGHGADQTSRIGTVVGASEPPGFSYSLTPPSTKYVRYNGAWVPYTRHVRQGGVWVAST